jgi:hypothetical protein
LQAGLRFQIILTTPNVPITVCYPNVKQVLKTKKKKGIKKDTKERIACKLVAAEASTLCITLNFVVLPILNNCSKRKVLQSEKLLVEHANDKLQMHIYILN